jgi:hypothetical protein
MREHVTAATWIVALVALSTIDAIAAGEATRLLEALQVEDGLGVFEVRIVFTSPVRYMAHTPRVPADVVRVRVVPVGTSSFGGGGADALQPPRDDHSPLRSVRIERAAGAEAEVELRFTQTVPIEVVQGRDLRSLVVRIHTAPQARAGLAPPAPADAAPTPETEARAAELMAEGRRAFTAGNFKRAALIFGEVARLPENDHSLEALELLGLARERTGQLAHAKAEYEEYLRRAPDGEGADRVRQRLAALTTARAVPKGPLRARPESRPALDLQTFGSIYTSFRRESLFSDQGETLVDNSLLSDIHLDTRLRRRGLSLRSRLSASYWHGFLEQGSEGQARIYSAVLEAGNPSLGLTGSIGRRSASSRGVIGRFDGVELGYAFGERFQVGAVAGFPLDTTSLEDFEPSRYLAGLSAGAHGLWENVDANLFVIGQRDGSLMDRAALGGELRYFSDGRMAAAFLDFDFYFQSLNVAQLIGSWQVDPRTFVTATFDHRNVPILTTANALIGQPVGDLDGLSQLFSDSQIKQLAEDRTGRSTTISFTGTYDLTPLLQLGGDVIASKFHGTESSGGVEGFDGTDFEFTYVARLVANDVFKDGDVGVVTLRFYDGANSDIIGTTLDARYPLTPRLRLNPRLWADYRMNDFGGDMVRVVPSLRCDWRVMRFEIEPEVGFEWFEPVGGLDSRRLGYFVTLGARYDF